MPKVNAFALFFAGLVEKSCIFDKQDFVFEGSERTTAVHDTLDELELVDLAFSQTVTHIRIFSPSIACLSYFKFGSSNFIMSFIK